VHVASGDRPYQAPAFSLSNRERDEQRSTVLISANRDQPIFVRGMRWIGRDARLPSYNRLYFAYRNAVAFALRPISRIPFEAVDNEIHREI
jgi:hypothetical protein